jgi:hypothetical protein
MDACSFTSEIIINIFCTYLNILSCYISPTNLNFVQVGLLPFTLCEVSVKSNRNKLN